MEAKTPEAPLVLMGPTYTMNPHAPWAEAVVVVEGRIVYVGSKEGAKQYITPTATVINVSSDAGGGMILPGFQDAHVHPLSGIIIEQSCDVARCPNLDAALDKILAYAEAHPELTWIVGGGWDVSWFPDGLSTAAILDSVVPDRPAILRRVDGHALWANTAAMKAIDVFRADVADPPHGRIDRDKATGLPLGSFQEQAADLFQRHIPELPPDARLGALALGMERMAGLGITAFQDALIRGPNVAAYAAAMRDPARFPLKASVCLWWDFHHARDGDADAARQVEEQLKKLVAHREDFARLREETGNRLVRVNTIKLMLDGVMETKTAYLHEPYCRCREGGHHAEHRPDGDKEGKANEDEDGGDAQSHRGIANFPREYLRQVVDAVDRAGFQIHCHSIGDNALSDVMDAFEAAKRAREAEAAASDGRDGWRPEVRRHQVAHLQVVRPDDVGRFATLGVIANFQPLWSHRDRWMVLAERHLSPARSAWQYPIRQVLDSGAHVAFGSDWFVSSMNPLDGIEVAVTHLAPGTNPESPEAAKNLFNPQERIKLDEALRAYTLGSAYANFLDDETGSIEVGKAADIILLDKNLFEVPSHEIHAAKVTHTFVDGRLVYSAPTQQQN